MKERIKFTTRDAALKDGTLFNEFRDEDLFDKVVSIASIIKSFTKNVEIDVANCKDVSRGEAWFYMKNRNVDERFNNATAYKVLVNLIDPSIKVSAFLWPDNDNGTRDDVIDVNFFGYTFNTGRSDDEQAKREEQAMKQGREYARRHAELLLKESAERLNQGSKSEVDENIPVNPMRLMNLWASDDDECYPDDE